VTALAVASLAVVSPGAMVASSELLVETVDRPARRRLDPLVLDLGSVGTIQADLPRDGRAGRQPPRRRPTAAEPPRRRPPAAALPAAPPAAGWGGDTDEDDDGVVVVVRQPVVRKVVIKKVVVVVRGPRRPP
jgi:hypothetical protein